METKKETINNNSKVKQIGNTPFCTLKQGKQFTIVLGDQIVTFNKFRTRKEAEEYIIQIPALDVILTTIITVIKNQNIKEK